MPAESTGGVRESFRENPPSRSMRALGVLVTLYEKVSGLSGQFRPEIVPVRREIDVVLDRVDPVGDGVVSLRLVAADGSALPSWHPGAHLDLTLPSGRVRQYSLTGAADDPAWTIAVRAIPDGGGGSLEVHRLEPGARLVVRGPRNAFPFISVDRYLFVAGGIGITPIRPMLRDAIARGADWQFVLTGRTRASMPFLDELEALAAEHPDRVHLRPDDEFGVPDGKEVLAHAPDGAALYCCGPPPMIDAIRAAIPVRYGPAEHIATLHYERFSPPPVVGGEPFTVVLARSGHVVPVASDQSALAAVREVLPDVAYSCQQGYCGTCPVALLGGDVQHHDRCLSDAEREHAFALCVSRATDRVTLDL
ncbi:PDR/VanB family oxidoreductase [Marmoricola sp. RAF53]|uniref:PDR/VanB family oxidoreductase n=1 Tax=Marmoricola sp. RAF53 TaxID=3233059 RepID=UPI003F9C631F